MTKQKLANAAIRAARTFAQTFIGVYLAGLVVGPGLADLADITLISSAAAAGFVAVLSFAQNWLEQLGEGVEFNRG